MTTRRYRITGMHCASCGLLVDDTLEDIPGIASSSTDVRASRAVVDLQPGAALSDDTILAAITGLGYEAHPDT